MNVFFFFWPIRGICVGWLSGLLLLSNGLAADEVLKWDAKSLERAVSLGEQTAKGTFVFSNSGTEAVVITDVVSGCTCLQGTADKDVVESGGKGEISFTMDLRGRRGLTKKELLVRTNNPTEPAIVLTVVVNIQ